MWGNGEECNEDEIGFKSYVSQETIYSNQRDYHFVKMVKGSTAWEKRGEFAASPISEDEIKQGRLQQKNNIWIETINKNDEIEELGNLNGVGKVSGIFTESSFTYDECDSFCLKIDRQHSKKTISR